MKYLMLLYGKPIPEPGTPEARKLFEDWAEAKQANKGPRRPVPAITRRLAWASWLMTFKR